MRSEMDLFENKELRNQLATRIDVLEKVKELLLIPQTDVATVKQVSVFYNVNEKVIEQIYMTHKEELESDGMTLKKSNEFLNLDNLGITKMQGKSILKLTNGDDLILPNRGLKVFPRRAILRIGMLLRDSEVAKEVRNQLLNIEEKSSNEVKIQDITEEQKLAIEVGMAFASGDTTAIMIATTNMMAFKNRHITKLEQSNKALANGILEWEDRSRINFAVRKLSQTAHIQYGQLWNELYKQLKNKFHMDLKARGKQPWIQYVKEDEWNNTIKCFSALCEYYQQEPSEMFCDMKLQEVSANA